MEREEVKKPGDLVKVKNIPGFIDIWVTPGEEYKLLKLVKEPAIEGSQCYRNCGHPMHAPKPERTFFVVIGNFGKEATILSDCFE